MFKYLIVNLVFPNLGFWSGNFFLIAPFPDRCLLVPLVMPHHIVQLSRCFERSRNAQNLLIPSKNVLRVTCASLASHSRVTRE